MYKNLENFLFGGGGILRMNISKKHLILVLLIFNIDFWLYIYIASPKIKGAEDNLSAGIGPETWPSN
jgi:hypothetical protein